MLKVRHVDIHVLQPSGAWTPPHVKVKKREAGSPDLESGVCCVCVHNVNRNVWYAVVR